MERLNNLIERYGEVCNQQKAGKILNPEPSTIGRMMKDGRLHGVEHRVDVRSICDPRKANFAAKARRNRPRTELSSADFMAAARKGRWGR